MIRLARPADARRLAQIEKAQPLSAQWGEKGFADEIQNKAAAVWCWEEDGALAGFVSLRLAAGFCEILNVAVHPTWCRKGIGSRLLAHALADVRARGGEKATLEVNAQNAAAVALYAKAGFQKLGVRKKFYNGTDDALIMGVNL